VTTESDPLLSLGRRAVACKAWRWMPGMRAVMLDTDSDGREFVHMGYRYVGTDDSGDAGATDALISTRGWRVWCMDVRQCLPDLADPATLGATIALAREAWSGRGMQGATLTMQAWRATAKRIWWRPESLGMAAHRLMEPVDGEYRWGEPATEAEAWVRALELAP
jgi:hypothetical protein